MAKVIYKYEVPADPHIGVSLPAGALIRKVAPQRGRVYLWAEVDPDEQCLFNGRTFRIFATGQRGVHGRYLDTVFAGGLVWHVYETTP